MSYEINVYFKGKHLFTTKLLTGNEETIREVYRILKEVLTESKEYTIFITKWELYMLK